MRKKIIILLTLIAIAILWFDQSRSFYCLDNNKCVTVWKRIGGSCFVIPGKYYGVLQPYDNYIKTLNVESLALYWSDQLPKTLVVRCANTCEIINEDRAEMVIERFDSKMRGILYGAGAKRFNEISRDADLMEIIIKQNYATDKDGEKL